MFFCYQRAEFPPVFFVSNHLVREGKNIAKFRKARLLLATLERTHITRVTASPEEADGENCTKILHEMPSLGRLRRQVRLESRLLGNPFERNTVSAVWTVENH